MKNIDIKRENRIRRHKRVRSQVSGTAETPRLAVFKSNKFIYAQLINDDKGETISSVDSRTSKAKTKLEQAKEIGSKIATEAKAKKITKVIFDRGGFIFTGKVKAVAEGAREGGLEF